MHAFVQAVYWLALATWFGTVLMAAVAPPVIVRVTREADPTLPRVLGVNLDRQHGTLLAGMIVGEVLSTLFRLQAVCAAVLLPALAVQWIFVDKSGTRLLLPLLVSGLFAVASVYLAYGWRVVWPKVLGHRTRYIEHADDPDVANAELDQFDRYSAELFTVVRNLLIALMGMILFSAGFTQRVQELVAG